MKISYLHIRNYKQFSDLELDLTYPKGHEKAGEPLDKICIIGQSGTGKTNLLYIITSSVRNNFQFINNFLTKESSINITYLMKNNKLLEINSLKIAIVKLEKEKDENTYFIDTTKEATNETWSILKSRIDNYSNERLKYVNTLSNKLMSIDTYGKKNFKEDMKNWENKNNNVLEQISTKLNEILIQFNLQLTKIDKNSLSYTALTFKDLSNNEIFDYYNISTGTKNLLSTFIPLKSYNPKDSIILIDEPENSFYPDIQRKLTDLYMNVGENNQLIMATHSPLIASSFEPWEVVELKFDKDNQIYREKYYQGDNHIDNYIVDPRMLTWTGILTDVFDLKEDSNFTFREQKLMEYATLKSEIKQMKSQKEKEKAFEKLKRVSKILGIYN